ncbi:MAG: hypothetical protein A3G33_08155 [Omnitrophica bacterium RIFCSPLOWO2_12_FULL_44_17]|uniref:Uncharacterized protein n=1 Tax=Candidatus Danuiimicrobium aquiferis TaxID=1801832 RepID=A0A1G1KXX3_9BACT|nr:MAG: hypothetical protein A3B72_05855 [Omnitrophica bacterium RIFCSPHIGHO2_02_FULL_45_28]OGW89757.1 MAG: hypothetical protein A3E74_06320 [Omnitrophica bacterium RIFCSPHIGHO2_12_FULL_44_12]OGW97775.1 MAG: hypothetical protein A3G33_08155 [Omnitrophica bacterium RIFCSPLOWO2_12_FULL_44_17]
MTTTITRSGEQGKVETPTAFNPCNLFKLRTLIARAFFQSGKSSKEIAFDLGVSYQFLANAANPNFGSFKFPFLRAIDLVKASGDSGLLEYFAHACNFSIFRLPEAPISEQAFVQLGQNVFSSLDMLETTLLEILFKKSSDFDTFQQELWWAITALVRLKIAAEKFRSEATK